MRGWPTRRLPTSGALRVGVESDIYLDSREGRRDFAYLSADRPARFAELREKPFLERRMRAWQLLLEPMERTREDLAWTVADFLVEVPDVPLLGLEVLQKLLALVHGVVLGVRAERVPHLVAVPAVDVGVLSDGKAPAVGGVWVRVRGRIEKFKFMRWT